jgi:FMN-dependent NADH-azoreductase
MSKVLYITANPKTKETSFSLAVGDEFLKAYVAANPQDVVTTLDLYKTEVQLIDENVLSAWGKFAGGVTFEQLTSAEQKAVAAMSGLLDQFLASDKYVFVTPLWNFTVPPKMKAYLDNICIVNKTFKYTQNGPVGLLEGKKAVHIQARGGIYSSGPAAELELGDRYINTILGFIGVTDRQSIIIEGANYAPEKAGEIKANAINKAKEVASKF